MKKYVLFASAILAFASCTSDSFTGTEEAGRLAQGDKPISFGFDVPAATRAEGAAAATLLGNQFIVYGEKSEDADGYKYDKAADDAHQLVFQNYVVKYTPSTAYTTTSNTKNWEYVGLDQTYGTNVTPQAGETQTIKYWDYSATNYVFTAFSALNTDLSSGNVKVTKIQEKTDGNKVYDKGYTVVLTADADPTKLYFSDRQVVITKNTTVNREAPNEYGGNVTFTFRNGVSQVRAAMYEDIPGYQVELDKFYYTNANAAPGFDDMNTPGADKFYANVPNLTMDKGVTLEVTYYNEGTRQNQPKIALRTGTEMNKYLALGTNLKDGTTLGESVSAAVYDQSSKAYTSVFPQESNATNLKLKVDYTLKNAKTGETIAVKGATAEIPAEYLRWKPNFKYTYIFKISDNTNGHTGDGTDPAGLYPITFDAAVIVAEDGQAEYITTVSEPSITTFGVKGNKYVHDGNEYEAGSDIYATFMEGSTVKDPTLGGNGAQHVNVYAVTTTDATNFPITEASVAEAIANPAMSVDIYTYDGSSTYTKVTDATTIAPGTTYYKADGSSNAPGAGGYTQTEAVAGTDYKVGAKLNIININTDASTYFTTAPAKVTTVPGEDGVNITQNALKLTGVAATTATTAYAIEYEASNEWTGTYKKVYKVIRVQ